MAKALGGRAFGSQGTQLHNETHAFLRGPRTFIDILPLWVTGSRPLSARKQALIGLKSLGFLALDFAATKTTRNKSVVRGHPVHGTFVTATSMGLDTCARVTVGVW